MRKVCLIVLGFLMAIASVSYAAGGTVNDISSDKWLDHLSQMKVIRQQILELLTKSNPTARDKEMLEALQISFNNQKAEWDSYLEDVAHGRTTQCVAKTRTSCNNHKHKKKNWKKSHKKGRGCNDCSSKKASCVSACTETVVCNGGVDCPSCPFYRTSKCCKVSGSCPSGHGHCQHHKKAVKSTP